MAEKIQATIHNSPEFEHPITVSMGISVFTRTRTTADELVKEADLALYEAKQTGRNRICVFEENDKES